MDGLVWRLPRPPTEIASNALSVAQWPSTDDLERDCSIKTFLSRTVNNALTATSNFFL